MDKDIFALQTWGATGLVSLVETKELALVRDLEFNRLESTLASHGLWWRHLPIRDRCVPDDGFEKLWCHEGSGLRQALARGESFAFHCWAGLGRTGMMTARVLIEMGCEPDEAVRRVRSARPGTIETEEQERFLKVLGVKTQS